MSLPRKTLKRLIRAAPALARVVVEQSLEVVHTTLDTLHSACGVLADAGSELRVVVHRARAELRAVPHEGRERVDRQFRERVAPTPKAVTSVLEQRISAGGHPAPGIRVGAGTASAAGFTPPPSMDAT